MSLTESIFFEYQKDLTKEASN